MAVGSVFNRLLADLNLWQRAFQPQPQNPNGASRTGSPAIPGLRDEFVGSADKASALRNQGDSFDAAGTGSTGGVEGELLEDVIQIVSALADLFSKLLGGLGQPNPAKASGGTDSPSSPVTGAPSGAPTTNTPADPTNGGPTNTGTPTPPSGSQPGAPVGNFETRHWGGTAGQFDKVYQFKGDDSTQPSFGGWAWSKPNLGAIEKAGFNWFEVGYPTSLNSADYQNLRDHGVRPFAYVNMGEVSPDLRGQVGSVPILKHNSDWNTDVVDVRDPKWQQWLIKRANDAYDRGARGIKWDCAGIENNYKDPAQKRQAIDAMGKVMETLKQQHPDFKFIVNQGYGLANKFPQVVDGVETESLMSARDQGGGMTQWANEEITKVKDLHQKYGIPIFMADYTDPNSGTAQRWTSTIESWGLTPYITNVQWNIPGRGLNINPGW